MNLKEKNGSSSEKAVPEDYLKATIRFILLKKYPELRYFIDEIMI